jgi:glutaminyl-tRNA synthetase
LKHAYYITCAEVIKDETTGEIVELRCTYDPQTRGGWSQDGRKVKGTLHWVSAAHAVEAEVRLYEKLFTHETPNDVEEGKDFTDYINPGSIEILTACRIEPGLAAAPPGSRYQFLRLGYFCVDTKYSTVQKPVFNRTVTLKDTWAKIDKAQKQKKSSDRRL